CRVRVDVANREDGVNLRVLQQVTLESLGDSSRRSEGRGRQWEDRTFASTGRDAFGHAFAEGFDVGRARKRVEADRVLEVVLGEVVAGGVAGLVRVAANEIHSA